MRKLYFLLFYPNIQQSSAMSFSNVRKDKSFLKILIN